MNKKILSQLSVRLKQIIKLHFVILFLSTLLTIAKTVVVPFYIPLPFNSVSKYVEKYKEPTIRKKQC